MTISKPISEERFYFALGVTRLALEFPDLAPSELLEFVERYATSSIDSRWYAKVSMEIRRLLYGSVPFNASRAWDETQAKAMAARTDREMLHGVSKDELISVIHELGARLATLRGSFAVARGVIEDSRQRLYTNNEYENRGYLAGLETFSAWITRFVREAGE